MEPIPETVQVIHDFGPFVVEDEDLVVELRAKADRVRSVVPQCVGLSLASNEDGVAFTLVATAQEIAVLDAVQYLAGGPCVTAVDEERVLQYEPALDEREWHLFARATSAMSITSTLTLPVLSGSTVIGSVNLYASTPEAFDGHHEAVAEVFGAWAPGAVTNADLLFSTRDVAQQAPQRLREEIDIHVAIGMIAHASSMDAEAAHAHLRDAARRAGVSEAVMATVLMRLDRLQDSD